MRLKPPPPIYPTGNQAPQSKQILFGNACWVHLMCVVLHEREDFWMSKSRSGRELNSIPADQPLDGDRRKNGLMVLHTPRLTSTLINGKIMKNCKKERGVQKEPAFEKRGLRSFVPEWVYLECPADILMFRSRTQRSTRCTTSPEVPATHSTHLTLHLSSLQLYRVHVKTPPAHNQMSRTLTQIYQKPDKLAAQHATQPTRTAADHRKDGNHGPRDKPGELPKRNSENRRPRRK